MSWYRLVVGVFDTLMPRDQQHPAASIFSAGSAICQACGVQDTSTDDGWPGFCESLCQLESGLCIAGGTQTASEAVFRRRRAPRHVTGAHVLCKTLGWQPLQRSLCRLCSVEMISRDLWPFITRDKEKTMRTARSKQELRAHYKHYVGLNVLPCKKKTWAGHDFR